MTSTVEICNLALSNIGKSNIVSLSEASAEARACNQFFGVTLRLLISSYPWRFSVKQASLAEIENNRVGEWGYAYQVPIDCMSPIRIREEFTATPIIPSDVAAYLMPEGNRYDVAGETIYCDLSPAVLIYSSDLTDTSKLPPLFVEALAWHLAVRLCMPLTRDPTIRKATFDMANRVLAQAQADDANMVRTSTDVSSTYERARWDGAR